LRSGFCSFRSRQLGGSLGIAILQLLQTRYEDTAYANLASGVTLGNPNVQQYMNGAHANATQLYSMVMLNATVISYDNVIRLCGIVFVLSIPLVFLLKWTRTKEVDEPAGVALD
jgi:hypothetical protein